MHTRAVHVAIAAAEALNRGVRAEIIGLCEHAYNLDVSRLFDELPGSVHVLARNDRGTLICHAEWVTRWLQPTRFPPLRTACVEAVATAPEHRRQGLATTVLRHLIDAVATDPTWRLSAFSPAETSIYRRAGWEIRQGPLAIRRGGTLEPSPADEQVMIRWLPATPAALDVTALLTAEWRIGELW